ncbi:MAG TPA: hypothetical protein VKV20_08145 [Ktedonobacteraceae bacterium]|jgi:hypothetical protein|nr:hypothetical protein [Ktedonobacteraceae bacterium]
MQIDIEPDGWQTDTSPFNNLPTGASVWIDPAVYAPPIEPPRSKAKGQQRQSNVSSSASSPLKKHPNPITPIPPQDSIARAANSSFELERARQAASTIWEYESENYAVGTSLPSLSLLVPETPTLPQVTSSSNVRETRRLPRIDEIDTTPPPARSIEQVPATPHQPVSLRLDEVGMTELSPVQFQRGSQLSIEEIDTLPDVYVGVGGPGSISALKHPTARSQEPHPLLPVDVPPELPQGFHPLVSSTLVPNTISRALVPHAQENGIIEDDTASWTAGKAINSSHARLIADPTLRKKRRQKTITLNPLDRVRWWLLLPGRIEFILWLFGTLLLIFVTCSLLLLTAFSLNWFSPALPGDTSSRVASAEPGTTSQATAASTITTTPGLSLNLLDKGPFLPGQPVHLRGQGFSHHGKVSFMYNGMQVLVDQQGNALTTQADAHGAFTVTIWTGDGDIWHIGHNIIVARDSKTNHVAAVDIVLDAASLGKARSTAPVTISTPGATPTGSSGSTGGGTQPTPVGQTPVPITPTVTSTPSPAPSPSPTQAPPSPSPSPSPSPTSTVGSTPTPTGTPGGNATPSNGSNSSGASSLGNALNSGGSGSSFSSSLAGFNPLALLMIACYALSLALLGVAGVLHRRKK